MGNGRWTRDEFLVTLDVYLNEDGVVEDASDPRVQEIASLIGRTPGSVALRFANYRHFDPESTQGMENTGKACREIWEEFCGNEEELEHEAEFAYQRLSNTDGEASESESPGTTEVQTSERATTRTERRGQSDFRKEVRERYQDTCLLCDVSEPGLLQAGHILRWSDFTDERGDPANGILLCYTHHKAFDVNMYTISDSLNLVVRPGFNPDSEFLQETLVERDGEPIEFPEDPPLTEYLSTHNETQVYWWPPKE